MGEGLRVMSHLKGITDEKIDAILPKIESVNTSVSELPYTLDTQFTELKNDIATVKTDVASVQQAIAAANQLADLINGEVV